MPRRVWWVILGTGFCAMMLPGCAPLDSFMNRGGSAKDITGVSDKTQKPPSSLTQVEIDPNVTAPNRPADAAPANQGVAQTGPLEGSKKVLAQGYLVAEKMQPPAVLAPQIPPKPQPPVLDTVNRPPITDMPPQNLEAIERALHCLLNKQTEEAINILKSCFDPARQEYIMQLLIASTAINENKGNQLSPEEKTLLEQQLQSLLAALRQRGELTIDTMCLVEKCEGYGRFKPVSPDHAFQPLERVLIYVGLRNLAGKAGARGYETVLNGTVSIQNAAGDKPYRITDPNDNAVNGPTPRFDWFEVYNFAIPPDIPPGRYKLTIEIVDKTEQAHRIAKQHVDFVVAGPRGQ